jgi:hypothetical protein
MARLTFVPARAARRRRRLVRRPDARSWRDPHHPVRRAWSVWVARRCEIAELERRPELAAGAVVQLSSPAAARRWLAAFD